MKKRINKKATVFFILFLFVGISVIPISSSGSDEIVRSSELKLVIENINLETISFNAEIPEFCLSSVDYSDEKYAKISLEEEGYSTIEGQAKLPKIRRMIEIPQGSKPVINIESIKWEQTSLPELNLPSKIVPVQPPIVKSDSKEDFVIDKSYYKTNEMLPYETARVLEINQLRGRRFALIEISPVRYNPKTGSLELMVSCSLTLDVSNGMDIRETKAKIERYSTASFEQSYEQSFTNYGYYEQLADSSRDIEGYLIIVYDDFNEEITPLANWKTTLGYDTTVTLTSDIPGGATADNIKAYIQDAYDNWEIPPAYILLVGDTPQIPCHTGSVSGGETDSYFVRMDGDIFADIYIGRFPAEDEAQVTIMVDKTIYYEQGDFPAINWIKNATFIASDDQNRLAEDTHNYVIDTHLEPNDYNCIKIYEYFGGDTQDIYDALNAGSSLCIYSGHGGSTGWGCVPFSNSDVYNLENYYMYPFVCSHACSTSTYEGTSETFSEAWLRAEDKGGIAMWGSSVSTYWPEDDEIERRVFDAWWYDGLERIGQMTDQGMYDAYQQNPDLNIERFIESYNVMGDASIKIWSEDPFVPEHDIQVSNLDVPSVVAHGETQTVSALVTNVGNNTETNIAIDFLEDGSVLDTVIISSLDPMQSYPVSFNWNPDIGTYLIEVESQPITDEYDLTNNNVNKTVEVISAPAINVTPDNLNYMVPTDSTDTDTILVENLPSAEAELNYNISYGGDLGGSFLSANPETGSVPVSYSDTVTITVDTTGLDEGYYSGIIIIQSNDLDDPEVIVNVDLTVVYGNDMTAISINNPVEIIPDGSYIVNATIQNLGYYTQSDVLVNCSIYEGGLGGDILYEDFSTEPADWTITHTSGTAWEWDTDDERMENTYSSSTVNSGYLDSPILDCSGKSGINLSFWHDWEADYTSGDQDGYVRGSTDGGNTFPYLIDEFHHNDPAEETAVKTYDISSWANGQSDVIIRFDVYNDNDWHWYIDNFNVTAEITGPMVYSSETLVDTISNYETQYVEFSPAWDAVEGTYGIQITTLLPDDENPSNDIIAESIYVEGPELSYTPESHDFGNIEEGNTDSTTFEIWNSGIETLNYNLAPQESWMTDVNPNSGSSQGETDTITVNIDTTGLSVGTYTGEIDITSNGGDGIFTIYLQIIPEGADEIDVNQSLYDRGFPIRHAADGDWGAAQSFTATTTTITRAKLFLRTFGTPEFDLTVELREDGPKGPLVDTLTFTPAEIPSTWTWFEIDFEDTMVDSGTKYFIVLPPAPSGVTTSFGYEWGYALGNQYDDGSFWFTRDGGGLWRDLPDSYEFTFRTYGVS